MKGLVFKSPVRGFSIHQIFGEKYCTNFRTFLTRASALSRSLGAVVFAKLYSAHGTLAYNFIGRSVQSCALRQEIRAKAESTY